MEWGGRSISWNGVGGALGQGNMCGVGGALVGMNGRSISWNGVGGALVGMNGRSISWNGVGGALVGMGWEEH